MRERRPATSILGRARAGFRVAIVCALACTLGACRTREDAARNAAREGAVAAARSCDADAGDIEACRADVCRDHCAPYADSKSLAETCTSKCTGQGTCESDRDCTAGLVCMMIAPRLRRCQPRPDAN